MLKTAIIFVVIKVTNNEKFFNLYNILDDLLRKRYNINDFGVSVIFKRINELKSSIIPQDKIRGEQLDIIRNLRNSLAHIEKYNNEENFTISSSLIKTLQKEIEDIKNPLIANDICKKIDFVLTATFEDKIMNIASLMLKNGFTHVPILENGRLFGVFSQNTIFSCFVKQDGIIINEKTTIKEYKDFLPIESHETESFLFVSQDKKVDDLINLFTQKINGKRLVMIFVSKNGLASEKILGIITSYDILHK